MRVTPHHLVQAASVTCASGALLVALAGLAGADALLRPGGSPPIRPLAAAAIAWGSAAVLLGPLSYRRRTAYWLWLALMGAFTATAGAGIVARAVAPDAHAPSLGATTALVLIVLGLAIQRWLGRYEGLAGMLFVLTATFGGLALNAYSLVSASDIAKVGLYGSISLPASTGILLLSLAALTAGGRRGIAGLLARRGVGGQLARGVVPALLLFPGVLSAVVHLGAVLDLYPVELERSLSVSIITTAITLAFWPAAARIDRVEKHRERAEQLALADPLTGLANRRSLEHRMAIASANAARDGVPYTVMALDVDGLKRVNDTHGHAAGDRVIEAAASALHGAMRPLDTAARVGGDEFVALLPGVGEADVERATQRIAAEVKLRLRDPRFHGAGISAGHAVWSPGLDGLTVLAAADRALYEQKARLKALRVGREGIEPPQSKDG